MLYFKKVYLQNCSPGQLETSLRKAALKRTSSLDFASAVSDIGTNKYFVGYEGKRGLTFTRIKASPEKLLPKLIIKLPSNSNECYYQIRFSVVSMMVFFMFTLPWLLAVGLFVFGGGAFMNFLTLTGIYGFYWMMVFFELRLTTWRVRKAVLNRNVETVHWYKIAKFEL